MQAQCSIAIAILLNSQWDLIHLFVRWQKVLPFLLCLCCPGCRVQHNASTRRRKKFLFVMLASPRFTCTFSCAYACVVPVNGTSLHTSFGVYSCSPLSCLLSVNLKGETSGVSPSSSCCGSFTLVISTLINPIDSAYAAMAITANQIASNDLRDSWDSLSWGSPAGWACGLWFWLQSVGKWWGL